MQELFPVGAGVVIGGLVMFVRPGWLRVVLFVAGCLGFGFLASFITGELEESYNFLSVDALLVWFGGLVAVVLITAYRRRADIRRFLSGTTRQ